MRPLQGDAWPHWVKGERRLRPEAGWWWAERRNVIFPVEISPDLLSMFGTTDDDPYDLVEDFLADGGKFLALLQLPPKTYYDSRVGAIRHDGYEARQAEEAFDRASRK